jgi:lipoate-protein ligase A
MRNSIPSKEDFARAKAAMRKNDRGLSEVTLALKVKYKDKGVHELFIFCSPKDESFGAYIFYKYQDQITEFEQSGLSGEIREDLLEELENVGRGNKNEITLRTEFDSDENVQENYGGDYFDRLR